MSKDLLFITFVIDTSIKLAICAIFIAQFGLYPLYISKDCHKLWQMTNKRQYYLLELKNKNCQNIKRLPHSFYILKVKCTLSLCYATVVMKQYLMACCAHLLQNIQLVWISIFHITSPAAFNPQHAEFHEWNNPPSIYETFHYHFRDIMMKT